jgi:hypothetical protein
MHKCPSASGAQLLVFEDAHAILPRQLVVQLGLLGWQIRSAQRCSWQSS